MARKGWQDLFLLNNVLDAYTRLYRVARYTRPDELDGYRKLLDDSVIALVRHHDLIPGGQQSQDLLEDMSLTLSTYYPTYTDRTGEACISGDFAGLCKSPVRVEDVLPFEHTCSPTLRLRAQDLTLDQAEGSAVNWVPKSSGSTSRWRPAGSRWRTITTRRWNW